MSIAIGEYCFFDLLDNLQGRTFFLFKDTTISLLPYEPPKEEDNPSVNSLLLLGGNLAEQEDPVRNRSLLEWDLHLMQLKDFSNSVPNGFSEIAFR
jgi:hypothetical protein